MRASVTLAYDFTQGSLDAVRGGVTATQINASNPVLFDSDGMAGMLIGGPDASGLDLGFVQGSPDGFTVHVLATLNPQASGDIMVPYSIYDGDPAMGRQSSQVTSTSRVKYLGGTRHEVSVFADAIVSDTYGVLKYWESFDKSLLDPVLLSFSVRNSSSDSSHFRTWFNVHGRTYGPSLFTDDGTVAIDDLRGNLYLGLVWPENGDTPTRYFTKVHAVYFDSVPISATYLMNDVDSCIPSSMPTTTTTTTSTTATTPATTETDAATTTNTTSTIMITGGGVGDGASAVQVGDDAGTPSGTSGSLLTIILVILAITIALCALGFGMLALSRSRRRRQSTAKGGDFVLTGPMSAGGADEGKGGRVRRTSQSRSPRAKKTAAPKSPSSEYAAAAVSSDYSSMPTLAVGEGNEGYSTAHSLGSESTHDYRPLNSGTMSEYRPLQVPQDADDPIISPRRAAGYATISAPKERTHGYAQGTTSYDTTNLLGRRETVPGDSSYGVGDLSH